MNTPCKHGRVIPSSWGLMMEEMNLYLTSKVIFFLLIIKQGSIASTSVRRAKIAFFWGWFHKLIYALRQTICALRPTLEKIFTGAKVWRKAQKIGVSSLHYIIFNYFWLVFILWIFSTPFLKQYVYSSSTRTFLHNYEVGKKNKALV